MAEKPTLYLIHWRAKVEEARSRGAFTMDDEYEATDWELCAVGEGLDILRDIGLVREDEDFGDVPQNIRDLGNGFSQEVHEDDADGAAEILGRLEAAFGRWMKRRAAELGKED